MGTVESGDLQADLLAALDTATNTASRSCKNWVVSTLPRFGGCLP